MTFAAMLLANLGAEVVRVNRPGSAGGASNMVANSLAAYRLSVVIDLRSDDGREALLCLCEAADVVIEAARPGVMEKLGIGPDVCTARRSRPVYARSVVRLRPDGPMSNAPGQRQQLHRVAGRSVGGRPRAATHSAEGISSATFSEVAPAFLRTPGRRKLDLDRSLEELVKRWGLTELQEIVVRVRALVGVGG